MSFNQSRSDKTEQQYRKSGRSASSNQQRNSSGGYGKGGGGGGGGPAPSPSLSSSSASSRSFKKSNNAQGGQSRVNSPAVNSAESANASATRNIQNGAHAQPQLKGASDLPVASSAAKPVESHANQRSTRAVPKAPTSQSATLCSDSSIPATPTKGDAPQAFSLQFGSISPGFMNGMQIPARTSSAPPNLDEQKRDQACQDSSFRPASNLPTPAPKQQPPKKDSAVIDQSNSGEAHPVPKVKKDLQASAGPPLNQTQNPALLNIPMAAMQLPFHHQPQVSMQFGGPNPHIRSQTTSVQMPMHMPLPMGNGPQVMQQPVFVPGLQPLPLPPQGMMHQGQGLSFTQPLGGQLAPQLGNMGMGITPQYSPQQGGKFGVPPKTTPVKITHPETREELRLNKRTDTYVDGGSSAPRSHPNVPPQSQPVPSFAPSHSVDYYSNSYNANSMFYPPPTSLPLSSSQIAVTPNGQGPRFNFPAGQSHQNISYMNSATAHGSLSVNKSVNLGPGTSESPSLELAPDGHNVASSAPSGITHVTVKPVAVSVGEKVSDSSLSISLAPVEKVGSLKPSVTSSEGSLSQAQRDLETCQDISIQLLKPERESLSSKGLPAVAGVGAANLGESVSSAPVATFQESVLTVASKEGRVDNLTYNSMKDNQKKPAKKGLTQPPNQSMSISSLASQTADHGIPSQRTKTALASSAAADVLSQPIQELSSLNDASTSPIEQSMSISSLASQTAVHGISSQRTKTALASSSAADVLSQPTQELSSINDASTSPIEQRTDSKNEGLTSVSSEVSGTGINVECLDMVKHAKMDCSSKLDEQLKPEINGIKDPLKSVELKSDQESDLKATTTTNDVPTSVTAVLDEDVEVSVEDEGVSDTDVFTSKISDSTILESSHVDITFGSNASSSAIDSNEITVTKSGASDQHSALVTTPDLSDSISKYEGGVPVPSSKDKLAPELNRTKSTSNRGKKKRKEILQRADAAGTTSDLYMAFKGPEEKKETIIPSASADSNCNGANLKLVSHQSPQVDSTKSDKIAKAKAELDDWEDAADICAPKLENSENFEKAHEGLINHEEDGSGNISKKYSRDFLLKFAEQCADLPQGFEIASDIAEALMVSNVNTSHLVDRDSYPSPGRRIDRQSSGSRLDRRASGMVVDDRWMKLTGSFVPGRDAHIDLAYGAAAAGFQPVQGGNFGVPRHPRVPTSLPFVGGMFPGQMHPMSPQGWIPRSPVTDRWQRVPNYQQKGLISLPQTPLQMMHKAERKYEVGKVTDEEALKQRQLKAILNKLTPQNFEKLFEQVKAVNIDNAGTLTGVISQIFDKALMEPTFCEMYANFCSHLAGELPDFSEDNEKITFKRLLLNKCQEEFERGEREQEEANKVEEEGDAKQSVEEREEKRIKARRRMLGNIRLIGELYKKKMLTERIMHECIKKLLGEYENPDEEDVEALCKLMSTIGEMIDHPKAKVYMDAYFERMAKLSNNMKLSSRVRFMLKDAIDLRKNKWQQRRKVDGPKKIEEVHRDAAQERQAQTSRLARGPGINPGAKRAPLDFGPRASMLSSPGAQVGSYRGSSTQHRGLVAQDVRMDDRQSFVARNLSVPLPQRPVGDDSITLGPQGGLARGMAFRGPPAMSSTALADVSPISGDSKRAAAGLNGFSSPAASPAQGQISGFTQNIPPEKSWSEERLMEMSMAAIKEFYSARDEKEVGLCIKDLHSQSFHPRMISLWVTDSFERKDMERDLLAKLLVNLSRSHDGVLSQVQLVKGFESVLSTLEDTVNDAPKAAEFLGRIFAKTIVENVITLSEIGRLVHDGGEEPGCLRETGLAADVLGSTLVAIKTDKGETFLNEILASSRLRLEDFRPPHPNKSSILDKFVY
ncbi:eukaryotic translation initiation factor 4G, CUCUMOVIRUS MULTIPLICATION 2 [Hibiscus trionum]|uniref:Eukaryotic translation initiation factor 4G n=1 Tax=Hibiscus trionum TaxID=183268 RepID=A0A9W7IRP2_HIBTR|nr:eukaryotic translation initiation factor 4G, CUCUMOVIRUS MULTIPLICATION 2 [Hibiscus trionum]